MSENATSLLCQCQGLNADSYSRTNPRLTSKLEDLFQPQTAWATLCLEGEAIWFCLDSRDRQTHINPDTCVDVHRETSIQTGSCRTAILHSSMGAWVIALLGRTQCAQLYLILSRLRYKRDNFHYVNLIKLSDSHLIFQWEHSFINYPVSKGKKSTKTLSFFKDNIGKSESLLLKWVFCAAVHPHPGLAGWPLRAAVFL